MFVMGWWGSAPCLFFLCFRACLSGTLLAVAAEGKEKCDWVCTGLNSPAGVCPQVTTGLFSQSPALPNHKARRAVLLSAGRERAGSVRCWSHAAWSTRLSPRTGPQTNAISSRKPSPPTWALGVGRHTGVPMFPPRLEMDFVRPGRTTPS